MSLITVTISRSLPLQEMHDADQATVYDAEPKIGDRVQIACRRRNAPGR